MTIVPHDCGGESVESPHVYFCGNWLKIRCRKCLRVWLSDKGYAEEVTGLDDYPPEKELRARRDAWLKQQLERKDG